MAQANPISALKDLRFVLFMLLFIALLLAGVYFAGKWAAKSTPPKEVKIPADISPNAGQNFNPGPITDAIHEDIYAFFAPRNIKPYNVLSALSNAELVAIYNDWNKRYFKDDNETLKQALEGESLSFASVSFRATRDNLVSRMNSLNLI